MHKTPAHDHNLVNMVLAMLSWSRPFPGAAVRAPRALRAYSPRAADYHTVACDTLEAAFAIPRPSSYAVNST